MDGHYPDEAMKRTTKKFDNLNESLQIPRPHFGGLITDPTLRRVQQLENRVKRLEAKLLKNPSGCCCEFDKDGETIIKPCLAHKNWNPNG